jgi:hypothetical protein
LDEFCAWIFEVALDQIGFMARTLDLDGILDRIAAYVGLESARTGLPSSAHHLISEAFLRGSIARGEAPRVLGVGERTARTILGQLLEGGLLVSDSPKGPVRFGCPSPVVPYYFPKLYPETIEMSMQVAKGRG